MPEHDVENRAAVFGLPSCSKPLESITFVILDQPHPTSSRSVRRAYNMGSTVRSKKMAVSEPSSRLPAAMSGPCVRRDDPLKRYVYENSICDRPAARGERADRVRSTALDSIFKQRSSFADARSRPRDAKRPRRCLALPPGRQDHTTSPYAATSLVRSLGNRSQAEARHRIPPRVRDDHDTPLWWGGMRKVLDLIWGKWERKYLSENQK